MDIEEYKNLSVEDQCNLIKQLLAETVPRGEVKETAHAAGMSDWRLYKWRDPECEAHNIMRRELPLIMHHRRDLRLMHWLCGLFRHVAFPLPHSELSLEEISRHISLTLRETAAACHAVLEAADPASEAGPEITYQEYQALEAEISQAQRQLAALKEAVRRKSEQHASWPVRLVRRAVARAQSWHSGE